jgi:putative phosphoesterase
VLIGIVSDVHCNAPALRKAIELMGEVDERVCLGDSIREYLFSNEVVALLRDHGFITLQGNHEQVFFGPLGDRPRSASWIDPDLLQWLKQQPGHRTLQRKGREILLVHSTPWPSAHQYVCANDREFPRFGEVSADIVLYGHTHEPVVTRTGRVLVVNPGSTGEPRLRGDRLEMSCAVLEVGALDARIISFAL